MIRLVRAFRHLVHALLNDAKALPHLLDTHHGAVETVAVLAGWNIELELLVAAIRLLFAKVPFESAGAQHGTGDAPRDRFLGGDRAHALGAPLKNAIAQDFAIVLGELWRQVFQKVADHAVPSVW